MLAASGLFLLIVGETTRFFIWIEYNTAQTAAILQMQYAVKSEP